jgi:hypothetical protein
MRKLILAASLTLLSATAASASDIVYSGHEQAGAITADYTITTNGDLGAITFRDIVSFSVVLTDAAGSLSFGTVPGLDYTGGVGGDFFATATSLRVPATNGDAASFNAGAFDGDGDDLAEIVFGNLAGDAWTQVQLIDGSGAHNTQVVASGPEIAAAVVPEPAVWTMLILGVALVGCAARRRNAGVTQAA